MVLGNVKNMERVFAEDGELCLVSDGARQGEHHWVGGAIAAFTSDQAGQPLIPGRPVSTAIVADKDPA